MFRIWEVIRDFDWSCFFNFGGVLFEVVFSVWRGCGRKCFFVNLVDRSYRRLVVYVLDIRGRSFG